MKVNKKSFKLDTKQYINTPQVKKMIMLGHTYTNNLSFFNYWGNSYNGKYKKTAPYSIDLDGSIYEHYSPKFYSKFTDNDIINKKTIPILLVNQGWAIRRNKSYFDCYDKLIKGYVIEQKWRNHKFWVKYTDEQFNSLFILIRYLCNEYNIPFNIIEDNLYKDIKNFNGIIYRSNYYQHSTDLSPAFEYEKLYNKINKIK